MKPQCLVYILAAIVVAFVFRGYFAAEEVQVILQAANKGNVEAITLTARHACESLDKFSNALNMYLLCLAVAIATCCRLKAPK